jgi:hypothetical protein
VQICGVAGKETVFLMNNWGCHTKDEILILLAKNQSNVIVLCVTYYPRFPDARSITSWEFWIAKAVDTFDRIYSGDHQLHDKKNVQPM